MITQEEIDRAVSLLGGEVVEVYIFDAVAIDTIPSTANRLLAYIDGDSPTYNACRARFPHAVIYTVTTGSTPGARICDCENGDDTPYSAALWAQAEIKAGRRPTIYCEIAMRGEVISELAALGLEFGRDVDCFVAWWTGLPDIPGGCVAIQFYRHSKYTYDESVALLSWAGPLPTPPEPPQGADYMFDAIKIVPTPEYPDTKGSVFLNGGSVWVGPLDEPSIKELTDNKATIFVSTTNSVFNAKDAVAYPANPKAAK